MSQLETLGTQAMSFRKFRRANSTDTSFASRVPMAAEPPLDDGTATAQVVIDLMDRTRTDGPVQNSAVIVPYGTGSDGDVFSMRVIGWRRIGTDPNADLWVPVKLCEVSCTVSSAVGVAGTTITASERFADTITLVGTSGHDGVNIDIVSPADNTVAHVVVDLKGFQKLELTFDPTTGMTDTNALIALI